MLYLIGLGLNEKGITLEGIEAIKKCKKIYLEIYTVDFPYSAEKLEKVIGKKIIKLDRKDVESDKIVNEAKKENIALLVYGSPIFATTHISLLMDCDKAKAKVKTYIIYSASVFDAVASCGLELYKFGKISSIPKWQKNFTPNSFLDYVIQNNSIKAHSLILVDIGLSFEDALNELKIASKKKDIFLEKIVVCSSLGTSKSKIYYGKIEELKSKGKKEKISAPFCFIIPAEMHFMEKEALERFE
ncbi:MAG: diphthine synthase [Nanoarchaeota archaeon]